AGIEYPGVLLPYLTLSIPGDPSAAQTAPAPGNGTPGATPVSVAFAPFGNTAAVYSPTTATITPPGPLLRHSPYARAWALSRRLLAGARTPYDYVVHVERYLHKGFRYDERTAPSAYPLETFLFKTKAGYCQQFAGAMALLLRMGGIPSRVAAGFTTGSYNSGAREWVVADTNAHAWVEAWFPQYGWVRFDPTPAAAPARGGHAPLPAIKNSGGGATSDTSKSQGLGNRVRNSASGPKAGGGGGAVAIPSLAILAAAIVIVVLLMVATVRLREPDSETLLAELERGLRRCGRPI